MRVKHEGKKRSARAVVEAMKFHCGRRALSGWGRIGLIAFSSGDEFLIRKVAVQNGKKVSAKVEFQVVKKTEAPPSGINGEGHDSLREVMQKCLEDAVYVTKTVNSIRWQTDDVRSIALTMFIQRSRNH